MSPAHEPWLVVLSLMVAFQDSYIGLHLMRKIGRSSGKNLRSLVATSTLFMAVAIWTAHFLGMLAIRVPTIIDFLVLSTLISFMICILVVGFSVFALSEGPPTPARIGLASVFLGTGVASTYFIGTLALHTDVVVTGEPRFIAVSIVLGILISMIALWIDFAAGSWSTSWFAALAMVASIFSVHYASASGMNVGGMASAVASGPTFSRELLAIIVSVIAFSMSRYFCLCSCRRSATPNMPLSAPTPQQTR